MSDVCFQIRSSLRVVCLSLRRIRQCVGEKNYKYFVSFLFLHSIWCLYLSVIGTLSLIEYLNRIHFYEMRFQIEGNVVIPDGYLAIQVLIILSSISS